MRVRVDRGLCQGHGTCCEEAPDVFELDADGRLSILLEAPAEQMKEQVRLAVKYCPTRALSLED